MALWAFLILSVLRHCPIICLSKPSACNGAVIIQRLEVEAEEMASFVQNKAHKPWGWIALDATTRQVIAFHVGDRSRRSAKRLWAKMPEGDRQHATFYTDQDDG